MERVENEIFVWIGGGMGHEGLAGVEFASGCGFGFFEDRDSVGGLADQGGDWDEVKLGVSIFFHKVQSGYVELEFLHKELSGEGVHLFAGPFDNINKLAIRPAICKQSIILFNFQENILHSHPQTMPLD